LGLVQGLPLNAHACYIQIVTSPKLAILSLSRLRWNGRRAKTKWSTRASSARLRSVPISRLTRPG